MAPVVVSQPVWGSTSMLWRMYTCMASGPQVCEHGSSLYTGSPIWQSTWQGTSSLQTCDSTCSPSESQLMPPCCAATYERLRDWSPEPQGALHMPHGAQSESSQSTGQVGPLHTYIPVSLGQDLPPWATSVTIVRVLEKLPLPQVLEQSEGGPQLDTSQCTAQGLASASHSPVWTEGPQTAPP